MIRMIPLPMKSDVYFSQTQTQYEVVALCWACVAHMHLHRWIRNLLYHYELQWPYSRSTPRVAKCQLDYLGYTVTESACLPLYGHAAQLYGYRNATLVAAGALTLVLLLSSMSFRLWQFSLSQVVVGTGAAGLEDLVNVIMNSESSPIRPGASD